MRLVQRLVNMIINYFNYFSHLLIFLYLIHLSNCNWLRLGIAGIHLPDQDYIRQFSQLQSTAQVNRNQSVKRMHSVNDSASVHQHRINNKKSSNNNSLSKYFSYSDDDDVFVNDFIHKATANVEYDSLLNQLNLAQLSFIKRNPNSLQVISSGTNIGWFIFSLFIILFLLLLLLKFSFIDLTFSSFVNAEVFRTF